MRYKKRKPVVRINDDQLVSTPAASQTATPAAFFFNFQFHQSIFHLHTNKSLSVIIINTVIINTTLVIVADYRSQIIQLSISTIIYYLQSTCKSLLLEAINQYIK